MIKANVKEARQNFSYLLDQVENGEEVLILRRGQIVAHILPYLPKKDAKKLPCLNEFRNSIDVKGTAIKNVNKSAHDFLPAPTHLTDHIRI